MGILKLFRQKMSPWSLYPQILVNNLQGNLYPLEGRINNQILEVKGLSQLYFEFELSKDDPDPISQQLARASPLLHQHDKTLFLHDSILHPCSSFKPAVRDFWEWHERPALFLVMIRLIICIYLSSQHAWYMVYEMDDMPLEIKGRWCSVISKLDQNRDSLFSKRVSERPANLPSPSDLG